MNATEPYVSVVQFGKLYRVVQILSLSRSSRYVWLFKRKLLSLWYYCLFKKWFELSSLCKIPKCGH